MRVELVLAPLLLSTGLAGCLGNTDLVPGASDAGVSPSAAIPRYEPGPENGSDRGLVEFGPVTRLPGPQSYEPMILAGPEGTTVVSAPASRSEPSIAFLGGYIWVSHDRGQTFTLERSRAVSPSLPATCSSCDTALTYQGDRFVTGTFYATVNPLWNVGLAASGDRGEDWMPLHPSPAREGAIDRPWLTAAPNGTLLLVYRHLPSTGDPVTETGAGDVFIQWGDGPPGTWTDAKLLISPDGEGMNRAVSYEKPRFTSSEMALVPYQVSTSSSDYENNTNYVARMSADGEVTSTRVSESYPYYAEFDLSIDTGPNGTVVASWAAPSGANETQTLHVRVSRDSGATWGPVHALPLPGSALQPWVAARDDGLVAIAHYGTDAEGPVLDLSENTPWKPRVTLLDAANPSQPLLLANLTEEPVYEGLLCNGSPRCPDSVRRTPMREFLSASWGPEGSLFAAYIDASGAADQRPLNPGREDRGDVGVTRLDPLGLEPGPRSDDGNGGSGDDPWNVDFGVDPRGAPVRG